MKHISKIEKVVKKVPEAPKSVLLGAMYKASSYGSTQNDALTFTRTGSNLLDFYAQAGAMRSKPEEAMKLFQAAFAEDRQSAMRVLFYLRDVRGGQGERDLFRNGLEWIGTNFPDVFKQIIGHVAEYGRWDDIFFDDAAVYELIEAQLNADVKTDKPSLLAKWLPTINASSPTTRAKAHQMAKALGATPVEYRKTVRDLRKKIKTVEALMSARKWEDINYSGVPSQAARIYKKAFAKHDEKRYGEFIAKATTGEVKINAGTLYPNQIYKDVQSNYTPTLEALWNQLPDYTRGQNALVVTDVSGSMQGDPMSVSVSLGLYFAERNKGIFQNYFITFSQKPMLQYVQGKTLLEKMASIENSEWGMNTDLEAVFYLILNAAVHHKVPVAEMPQTIYIISDMEFDSAVSGRTLHEDMKAKYEGEGYTMPNVVFWNVNASGKNMPVQKDENGVALVSGFSPVIFKMVTENKSPEEVMLDTINSERYAPIVVK